MARNNKPETKPTEPTASVGDKPETKPTEPTDVVLPSAPPVPPELRKERHVPTVEELMKDGMPRELAYGVVARETALFNGETAHNAEISYARAISRAAQTKAEPRLGEAPRVISAPDKDENGEPIGPPIDMATAFERFDKPATEKEGTVLGDAEAIFTASDGARVGARPNVHGRIILRALGPVDNIMRGEVFGEKPDVAYRLVKARVAVLMNRSQLKIVTAEDANSPR